MRNYYRERLINAYENNFWDGALKTVSALWDAHGWIWHGNLLLDIKHRGCD